MKENSVPTAFSNVFPDSTPVTLKQIAKELDRPIVVLRRWAKAGRFRNVLDTTGKPIILVPMAELPIINALPKGKGSTPKKPWKTRAAKMLREGKITLLTDEQQDAALDQSALSHTQQGDGSYLITPLERPTFLPLEKP